jgi:ABC-type antimicrobial peptide transport system permease subunit
MQEGEKLGRDAGVLDTATAGFGGTSLISEGGLAKLKQWFDSHYPGQVDFTYRQSIADTIGILTGVGVGTTVSVPASDKQANNVTPLVIDAAHYPFYGQVKSEDGKLLADLLQAPTDVVVSRNLADTLEVKVGDPLRLNGAESDFAVRGVVPTDAEAGFENIFAGMFGFYYLDLKATTLFPDMKIHSDMLYVKLSDPTQTVAVDSAFMQAFPYLSTTNTDDLRVQNSQTSDALNKLVSVMGLVSLLLGGIGIINTMQVIVRRRTLEVAVLKTLGLEANQITVLFLVEAFLMGVIGSIVGIVLGWVMTFLIKGAAEAFLAQSLPFRITLGPAVNGLLVGTLITTIFGFLPTLAAGQVRPGVVLRPNESVVPRTGCLGTLGALLVVIVAISAVAQTILGNFVTALEVVVGAFVTAGVLYLMLWVLIWLFGRFFPAFGVIDLKISLRAMLSARRRGATTLLALTIGVFSLSLITLMAESVNRLLGDMMANGIGGNLIIQTLGGGAADQVEKTLSTHAGVKSFSLNRVYGATFVSLSPAGGGETVSADAISARLARANVETNKLDALLSSLTGRDVSSNLPKVNFTEGRQLGADDAGKALLVLPADDVTKAAGFKVGDKLTFELGGGGLLAALSAKKTVTFELVGLYGPSVMQVNASGATEAYAPIGAFPPEIAPQRLAAVADVEDTEIPSLKRELSAVPGVFVLESKLINQLINSLLGQFTAFPVLVAALGLIVGGIVIANSVALSTMERRREIAIMKAVGLQRERVLGMLLLENGIMGLIGGLVGVGIGLIGLIIGIASLNALTPGGVIGGSAIPYGAALLLMGLCIVVALIAALTTAWSASGEKPLNVLRYE